MTAFVVYLFGSGLAFFVGVGFILTALAISLAESAALNRASTILGLLGVLLVAVSGTPLSLWYYAVAMTFTAVWLIALRARSSIWTRRAKTLGGLVAIVWIAALLGEMTYQRLPSTRISGSPALYLFGDSVSAGVSEEQSDNWPQLLARAHSVKISNYSVAGATVEMALRQANAATLGDGIVLIEIGGNDLLGTTLTEDFERNLDELLTRVCEGGQEVFMFELPIPPLRNRFGQIQRRLAATHNVHLIPKRVFIAVLTAEGATLDSIHLSARGHQQMAEMVWQIIRPAYEK